MAASPTTSDRPSVTTFRRSSSQFASLPQRSLSFHEKAGLAKDDAAADLLYAHPDVAIFTFQPPTDALQNLDRSQKTLPDADYPIDAIEVLPWRARKEQLEARGKMIIEKVQGSAHFLKAGKLIYTIMKNSQCWCVDGQAKFVMRIGKLRYLRIEFPFTDEDDKQKVETFKEAIAKILKFEKTPCPFIRAFQVDLPEDAITPRRRGQWTRRESLTPITPDEEPSASRRPKPSKAASLRGMPPSAFPSKSMSHFDMDRPRTASAPTNSRFSFPDVRTESPTAFSGDDYTDSERQDSESDRPDSSRYSGAEDSDRESNYVPIIKSPLKNVTTLSDSGARPGRPARRPSVKEKAALFDNRAKEESDRATTKPAKIGSTARRPSNQIEIPPAVRSLYESKDGPAQQKDKSPVRPFELMRRGSSDAALAQALTARRQERQLSQGSAADTSSAGEDTLHDSSPETTHADLLTEPKILPPILDAPVQPDVRRQGSVVDELLASEDSDVKQPLIETSYQPLPDAYIAPSGVKELNMLPNDTTDATEVQHETPDVIPPPVILPIATEEIEVAASAQLEDSATSDQQPNDGKPEHTDRVDDAEIAEAVIRLPTVDQHSGASSPLKAISSTDDLCRVTTNDDAESTVSVDSFHTLLSDDSRFDSQRQLNVRPSQHKRELSEMTVTPASAAAAAADKELAISESIENKSTVSVDILNQEAQEHTAAQSSALPSQINKNFEIRQRLRHQRSFSPLPPASILAPPTPEEHRTTVPAAILQKAAALAVVKPLEVVLLVVHVLTRIAGGATVSDLMNGDLFRRPGIRRTASGTFDSNIRGRPGIFKGDSEDEDDYGVPVRGRRRSSHAHHDADARTLQKGDDERSIDSVD